MDVTSMSIRERRNIIPKEALERLIEKRKLEKESDSVGHYHLDMNRRKLPPPAPYKTEREKDAYVKNRNEESRLNRIIDHINLEKVVNERMYEQDSHVIRVRSARFGGKRAISSLSEHTPDKTKSAVIHRHSAPPYANYRSGAEDPASKALKQPQVIDSGLETPLRLSLIGIVGQCHFTIGGSSKASSVKQTSQSDLSDHLNHQAGGATAHEKQKTATFEYPLTSTQNGVDSSFKAPNISVVETHGQHTHEPYKDRAIGGKSVVKPSQEKLQRYGTFPQAGRDHRDSSNRIYALLPESPSSSSIEDKEEGLLDVNTLMPGTSKPTPEGKKLLGKKSQSDMCGGGGTGSRERRSRISSVFNPSFAEAQLKQELKVMAMQRKKPKQKTFDYNAAVQDERSKYKMCSKKVDDFVEHMRQKNQQDKRTDSDIWSHTSGKQKPWV